MERDKRRLLFYFVAITVCFVFYSFTQEELMTVGFGPEGELFSFSVFVIFVNRLVTMAVAAAALALTGNSVRPSAPVWVFCIPSLSNVIASAAQYEALKYVSFPVQALAKCAKTVPVMLWGLVIGVRQYRGWDYVRSAAITAGCAIFIFTGDIAAPSIPDPAISLAGSGPLSRHWLVAGMSLLAAFLLFDGLASTSQDSLFSRYTMHSCNQLLYIAAWSALLSLGALVAAGQLGPAVDFILRHPASLKLILALSVLSTAAQMFIFVTIQQQGALYLAQVMTVRQFIAIVLSCSVFQHQLSTAQWMGTLLVIGALVQRGQIKTVAKKVAKEAPLGIPVSVIHPASKV